MENLGLYEDIAKRTDGDIYVGVVGPVRTGKSTFIKNFDLSPKEEFGIETTCPRNSASIGASGNKSS